MKKIGKIVFFIAMFFPLVVVGVFAAGGKEKAATPVTQADKAVPVKITVWTEYTAPPKATIMDEWISSFQRANPNIIVEHKGISNENWEETLRTAMLGGQPPDMFIVESRAETMEYMEAGLLYDLTDWYAARKDRFIPGYEFNTVINGRRYAIPYTILHVNMIWYNDAKLKSVGIDGSAIKTWDDLMKACATLKARGESAFQLGAGSLWPAGHFVYFLIQQNLAEKDWLKLARGEKNWTDPDVVAALTNLETMYKAGYFQSGVAADTRDVAQAAHFQGNGAFFSAGSWHLYQKGGKGVSPNWEFKFIPFPNFVGAPVKDVVLSTSNEHWALSSKSKNINEALLFLDHITSLEQAEKRAKGANEFLAIRGAVNKNTAGPEMVQIAAWVESGNVYNLLENYFTREVVQDGMWAGAQGVLSGQLTTLDWAKLIARIQTSSGNLSF